MKKKLWVRIVLWSLLLVLIAALAILPTVARNRNRSSSSTVVSCFPVQREIFSTLSGGGTLQVEDSKEVSLPDGVEVLRFLVKNGDLVTEGQGLADVDTLTVYSAITRVKDSLDELDAQITELEKDSFLILTSVAEGRVKAVYAQKGDDVRRVLTEYGSLGILSLDGLMSVSFSCEEEPLPGTGVLVRCPDGTEYSGKIVSSLKGTTEVTLTDDGPQLDDPALILDMDGNLLGSGILKVHSPWRILYADGTVQSVSLREGQKVRKGTVLIRIQNAGSTKREQLSAKHREYEELLPELLQMARTGEIVAPCAGFVSGIDETAASGMSSSVGHEIRLLADGDPAEETPPLVSSELLMVTAVDEKGYRGKVAPIDLESQDMDILGVFTGLAQTLLLGAEEVPLDLEGAQNPDGSALGAIQPGDVFVRIRFGEGDAAVSRLLYIGHTDLSSAVSIPGFQIPDFSSYFAAPESEDELYPLEGSSLLSVTPRESLFVLLSADELDILQYRKGMPAKILLDALPGESFEGTVTKIAGIGTNSGGSSKFSVTVELPWSSNMLPGMNASVVIRTGSSGPVPALPVAAIQDRGSQSFVYTGFDAKSETLCDPVSVVTGVSDGEWVEIVSGLNESQTVWYMTYNPNT